MQVTPQVPDDDGMVQIRMAETIEEFTYGNPHQHYNLEARASATGCLGTSPVTSIPSAMCTTADMT